MEFEEINSDIVSLDTSCSDHNIETASIKSINIFHVKKLIPRSGSDKTSEQQIPINKEVLGHKRYKTVPINIPVQMAGEWDSPPTTRRNIPEEAESGNLPQFLPPYLKANSILDIDIERLYERLIKDTKIVVDSQETIFSSANSLPTWDIIDSIQENLQILNKKLKEKYSLFEELKVLDKLGEGGQGSIFRVLDPYNRTFYAKKIMMNKRMDFDERALKEMQILLTIMRANDPSLLKIYNIEYKFGEQFSILMEYGHGDLESYTEFRRKNHLYWTENEVIQMSNQIYSQMQKLRNLHI